ncbi:MAG: High-affinity nickel transporter [Vicinamibacterales bacterium]
MIAAVAGIAAGALHVLAGPDHLAAVAPLAAGAGSRAWRPGVVWGIGHTAGVLAVGVLLWSARGLLPLEALSAWSERGVGLALIAVGTWGLWRARAAHAHHHAAAGASFGMGTLHGLAGSSHLFGVLPTLAFASPLDGAAYLAGFGLGAVLAMSGFAAVVGSLTLVAGPSRAAARRTLVYASSIAAVVVGGVWLVG